MLNLNRYLKLTGLLLVFFILWLPAMGLLVDYEPKYEIAGGKEKFEINFLFEDLLQGRSNYLTSYMNTNFGFRDVLLYEYSLFMAKFLNISTRPQVIIGRDGWLYYRSELWKEGEGHAYDDFQGRVSFSQDELEKIKNNLENLDKRLSNSNIDFILAVAPEKFRIYPEHLPLALQYNRGETRYDQFQKYMLINSNFEHVSVNEELLEKKKENILYFKTDSHWNSLGAFYFYQELGKRIKKSQSNMKVLELDDFDIEINNNASDGDLARIAVLYDYFSETSIDLIPKEPYEYRVEPYLINKVESGVVTINPKGELGTLIVFHDSFFHYITPFISKHFKKVIYINSKKVDFEIIEKEKPNIVIYEIAERYMDELLDPMK